MGQDVFLVEPGMEYKAQFIDYVDQYIHSGEQHYINKYRGAVQDFGKYLEKLQNDADGINLGKDSVAVITYWMVNAGGELLGVIRVRPSMDKEYVQRYTGNIGYDIAPAHRGKGYGTAILKLGLDKARELGLEKVLVTCDSGNIGSMKVIKNNGGVFESEVFNESKNEMIKRFWIEL